MRRCARGCCASTLSSPRRARETVAVETPAARATSRMVSARRRPARAQARPRVLVSRCPCATGRPLGHRVTCARRGQPRPVRVEHVLVAGVDGQVHGRRRCRGETGRGRHDERLGVASSPGIDAVDERVGAELLDELRPPSSARCGSLARSTASGRTPSTTSDSPGCLAAASAAARQRHDQVAEPGAAARSGSTVRRFIAGEPMKPATNALPAGRRGCAACRPAAARRP